jgi:hypothetical protein
MGELIEIGEVARTRPAADAPPEVQAAWYRRKAAMLTRLGANYHERAALAEARAAALSAALRPAGIT